MQLSVVIPAYLEEENLRGILPIMTRILEDGAITYEILVVDRPGLGDRTEELCREFPHVNYVVQQGGDNYGSAVRTGILKARAERLMFMDGDGSHDPEFVLKLWENRDDADILVASRYVSGGEIDNSKVLIFMSWCVNRIYGLVLGIDCLDLSTSFKLYHTEDLKKIKLYCKNFDIVEEILFKISRNKPDLTFKEIPFRFRKRLHGKTKRNLILFILTYIFTLLKLRLGR